MSDNDNDDDTSKKVVDYNINENQFAIEYTTIFEDGTSDYYIENKIIRRQQQKDFLFGLSISKRKKRNLKKKNQTNNSYFLSTNKKLHFKLDLKMNIKKNTT